ncbi:MAG: flagellar FliJ family protein [Desulfovibrio sp.]|jgi:flagellar export protein FliJ|nr:flagellar FliJ family protein [Desulfovibrio sp.]
MAPFRFRLEQVRLYRKQLEEQAMQRLALAVMERNRLLIRKEATEKELYGQRQRLCRPDLLEPAEFPVTLDYAGALARDLKDCVKALDAAEDQVDIRRRQLAEKAMERELLDRLEKKQADRHKLTELKQEQQRNDETATLRYRHAAV